MDEITMKAARVNAGLTQEQAAPKIGVSVSTIKNWESGKTSPTVVQIKKVGEVYGVPYDIIKV